MGIIGLNTVGLDGGNVIIKKGGGGGGGTPTPDTPSKPTWTGHADAEGLRAIGWTDEDIAYYQATGVNWNEEDDELHKVTDDNKALYGVLTADNISTYKSRIVYLPKINTRGLSNMKRMFRYCYFLVAIPMIDTSNVNSMYETFSNCHSLTSIPMLDTSKVSTMYHMFYSCYSLTSIPMLDTSNARDVMGLFCDCHSLKSIPMLDICNMTIETSMLLNCYSLTHVNLKNTKMSCNLSTVPLLTKSSLLYIINNEAATSTITIQLASYAYDRLATDPDIVAALANHPNISISK